MAHEPQIPAVYGAIARVAADISKVGIRKDHRNTQQGYAFRSIDDIYNLLGPILAQHQLVILPHVFSRELTERQTKAGTPLFAVVVGVEYRIVSAVDGSSHVVRVYGEAMDSADKATNKAMSAAYKYACIQSFAIPTEGDNDADATTPDVAQHPEPDGFADWWRELMKLSEGGIAALQKEWHESPPEYRRYVQTARAKEWAAVKAYAAQVKRAEVPAAEPITS